MTKRLVDSSSDSKCSNSASKQLIMTFIVSVRVSHCIIFKTARFSKFRNIFKRPRYFRCGFAYPHGHRGKLQAQESMYTSQILNLPGQFVQCFADTIQGACPDLFYQFRFYVKQTIQSGCCARSNAEKPGLTLDTLAARSSNNL